MVIDSTKLKCFMQCPRKYFFEFHLHWRPEGPNKHLEFGIAWHKAKEILLIDGTYDEASIKRAFIAFMEHYRKSFDSSTDAERKPKDPASAFEALHSYCEKFGEGNKRFKVLHTEVAGQVAMTFDDPPIVMAFKIDAVLQNESGLWILDHKTASVESQAFVESWQLSTQMGTYIYALSCFQPEATINGALVDVTFFRKKGMGTDAHLRIPVRRGDSSLSIWHWNTVDTLKRIAAEHERLESLEPNDDIMMAFPMNTENCCQYGRCPYMDFCQAWANPLQRCAQPPIGFKVEEWNPLEEEKTAKTVWKGNTNECPF